MNSNYLYLIQKKENHGTNLFKIGLIRSKDKINKNHRISLLLNNNNKLFKLSNLVREMSNKFLKSSKKNYFIGKENDIKLFILGYYKNLYTNKFEKIIEHNKFRMIKIICLSKIKDNEKYNTIVKLCDQKVELRNIIFDSNLSDFEKHTLINNMVEMKSVQAVQANQSNQSINNFGEENYNYIEYHDLSNALRTKTTIEILNEYLNIVHFNDIHPENHNIINSNNSIKIYENKKWRNNNTRNMQKILENSIKNVYYLIFTITVENSSDDFIYSKGLLVLKKINKLLELS